MPTSQKKEIGKKGLGSGVLRSAIAVLMSIFSVQKSTVRYHRRLVRIPMLERMELRKLMAADISYVSMNTVDTSLAATSGGSCAQVSEPTERVSATTETFDVNRDGQISELDFQLVVDYLSQRATGLNQANTVEGEPDQDSLSESMLENIDVNGDGLITPRDALLVVNRIQFYSPLVPCTCSTCLGETIGAICSNASNDRLDTVATQEVVAPVVLALEWSPQ